MGKLSEEFRKNSNDLLIKAGRSEIANLQFLIDNGDAAAAEAARLKQAALKQEVAKLEAERKS